MRFLAYLRAVWGKPATRHALPLSGILLLLAGCAKEPPAAPLVQPQVVEVTASDFCEIMARLHPTGKLMWSTADTPETITQARRLNAAYDKRCASPTTKASKPTS